MHAAQAYIDESISTCRFAQRVAMVSNTATVNEETDPALVIKALKQQVRDIKDQVKLLQVRQAQQTSINIFQSFIFQIYRPASVKYLCREGRKCGGR